MMLLVASAGSATLLSLWVCIASVYKKDTQKSAYFSLLALAVTFYMIGNFFEITSHSVEAAQVGIKIAYLGIPFIPPLWYLCVREYCGKKIEDWKIIALIMVIPITTMTLAFTLEFNTLLFSNFQYHSDNQLSQLHFDPGPLYKIKQIYLYLFNILGFYTIIKSYIKGTKQFRKQILFFFISVLIPIFNTERHLVNIGTYWFDITTYGLSITLLLFFVAIHKYGIENLSLIIKDSVVENLNEGIILFDSNGIYVNANSTAIRIFPQVKDIALGTSIEEMDYLPFNMQTLINNDRPKDFTKKYDDSIRTYSISISKVQRQGRILGYSISIHNITAIKTIMTDLETQAYTDPLTNIYNRRFFFEKFEYELQRAKLAGNPLSLIIFDLDFFKKINDTYGHAYGDYVLKTVAFLCTHNLRKTDILGRYGGEEFCILLPNTGLQGAKEKAESIRNKISGYIFESGSTIVSVTASFGVATLEDKHRKDTLEKLLERADAHLYQAKTTGKNKVV